MPQIAYPLSLRHRSAWLLALGLLAVALQALGGTGLLRPGASAGTGEKFAAEVCTSHGVVKAAAAQLPGAGSQPATDAHDCCKLCAAGAPLLIAGIGIAVSPAPTFTHPTLRRRRLPSAPRIPRAALPRAPEPPGVHPVLNVPPRYVRVESPSRIVAGNIHRQEFT
jgi:hypothetical protein